jgi:hypothetical protein
VDCAKRIKEKAKTHPYKTKGGAPAKATAKREAASLRSLGLLGSACGYQAADGVGVEIDGLQEVAFGDAFVCGVGYVDAAGA